MRDRDQRLHWIEKLIGTSHQGAIQHNALVISTRTGSIGLDFSSIVEVLSAARVQPLAFLPNDYCGVVLHGSTLVPVIDTEGGSASAAHVVIVEGEGCLLGLRFCDTPYVVNLDETQYEVMKARRVDRLEGDILRLLDVDDVINTLKATNERD